MKLLGLILLMNLFIIIRCRKYSGYRGVFLKEFISTKIEEKLTKDVYIKHGFDKNELIKALDNVGLSWGVTHTPSVRYLIDVYEKISTGEALLQAAGYTQSNSKLQHVDTVRGMQTSVQPRRRKSIEVNFKLQKSHREKMQLAELRLQNRDLQEYRIRRGVTAFIYKNNQVEAIIKYRLPGTSTDSDHNNLDITSLLEDLLSRGYKNRNVRLTLKLRPVTSSYQKHKRSLNYKTSNQHSAMIVVFAENRKFFKRFQRNISTDNSTSVRARRAANRLRPRGRKNCERKDFFVDFKSIGWAKWIVFPKKFNARQCIGRCPMPVDQKYHPTNHAILQSLMRLKDRSLVSRPCCVPVQLSPISMLYYEKGEVVVRQHEDMVVNKCGCR